MIFKSINLISFGKFQNRELTFRPTFNIIFGKNESGKSTLFHAIVGTLFGFKNDRDRYLPWSNRARYLSKLLLQSDTETISLERNFSDDTVTWQQESDDGRKLNFSAKVSPLGRSSERALYLNKLQKIFGFSEADIFKHSLFIEQRSLYSLPSPETTSERKKIIWNISEFKYDEILQCLEDKLFDITKKKIRGLPNT